MVKNETEFYKAFFFVPANQRSKVPSDDTAELIMKSFTGKLLLSNLENKKAFLLDYKDGVISEDFKKNDPNSKKPKSGGAATSGWETQCHYEMANCYFTTYSQSCGGQFQIAYVPDCQWPTWCQNATWILQDYGMQEVCQGVWFPDPPETPEDPGSGGTGSNPKEPTEDEYELTGIVDSIRMQDRFACFDNVTTDDNTVYSVKICTDVPNNSYPNDLLKDFSPGHAFIELTKTNGTASVTETIGFYPEKYKTASIGLTVNGIVNDNREHPYDASLLKMLNAQQFAATLNAALTAGATHNYNMRTYNCTNFALDVFNAQGYMLTIPDTQSAALNYGKTPNALYRDFKAKHTNLYPGASIAPGTGIVSNVCN